VMHKWRQCVGTGKSWPTTADAAAVSPSRAEPAVSSSKKKRKHGRDADNVQKSAKKQRIVEELCPPAEAVKQGLQVQLNEHVLVHAM
jgi:hypothetical protein